MTRTPFDYNPFSVGYDNLWKKLDDLASSVSKNIPSYPPYNIRKIEDNKYVIELAVAGFGRSDIEITLQDDKLVISGKSSDDDENNILYKGIANRAFTRTFTLADTIEVKNADLINGMLKVWLENIIPEHKKPRKIEVGETSSKKFLAEEK